MTPITEINLEQSAYNLLAAWLGGFFDGNAHALGTNPVNAAIVFPVAALGFAQSVLPQPMNPTPVVAGATPVPIVGITVVMGKTAGKPDRRTETVGGKRQQMFYKKVRLNFWIRSATADDTDRALCMNAGQLLEGLLANAAMTRVLAQNGIHRIRPGTSEPVADTTYILRLLPCEVTLKYSVSIS
jgi:hypothetical protein